MARMAFLVLMSILVCRHWSMSTADAAAVIASDQTMSNLENRNIIAATNNVALSDFLMATAHQRRCGTGAKI